MGSSLVCLGRRRSRIQSGEHRAVCNRENGPNEVSTVEIRVIEVPYSPTQSIVTVSTQSAPAVTVSVTGENYVLDVEFLAQIPRPEVPSMACIDKTGEPPRVETPLDEPANPGVLVLSMKLAMHRFFTFPLPREWNEIIEHNLTRQELANSGFFFTMDRMAVQCYYCRLKINEFQIVFGKGEQVNATHKRLSPLCSLMNDRCWVDVPLSAVVDQYRFESHRLYSLSLIDWEAPISIYDLAKYGFYKADPNGNSLNDNVRCFYCRMEVRGWEAGDRAEVEHRRWNINCPFINGHSFVGNIKMGMELDSLAFVQDEAGCHFSPVVINPFARAEMNHSDKISFDAKTHSLLSAEELNVTPIKPPKYPNFAKKQERLETFASWPAYITQQPDDLADAGFWYTGKFDFVVCFNCGGGLKQWAPKDTPWSQHAKWFSRCGFVLMTKGAEFVAQIQQEQKIEMPLAQLLSGMSVQQGDAVPAKRITIEETNKNSDAATVQKKRSLTCVHCKKRDLSTVNLPCGHMVACEWCINLEENCSRCGVQRNAYARLSM